MPFQLDSLDSALRHGGLAAGLRTLNDGVALRFTAVFQLEDGLIRCRGLHDKLSQLGPHDLADVPLFDSFCHLTLREGRLLTPDSSADPRLDGNPHRGQVTAYFGVPLLDNRGELYGTLCHFDPAGHTLTDAQFETLQQAARLLPDHLPR